MLLDLLRVASHYKVVNGLGLGEVNFKPRGLGYDGGHRVAKRQSSGLRSSWRGLDGPEFRRPGLGASALRGVYRMGGNGRFC